MLKEIYHTRFIMSKRKMLSLLMALVICASLFNGLVIKSDAVAAEDGLVVHLKFDNDLTDSSGNFNNAECEYGKITYEDGIHGQSAVFNGKSYIEIADNDSLDLDNMTISLWVYKTTHIKDYERVPYVYKEKDEEHWSVPFRLFEFGDNIPLYYLHGDDTNLDQFMLSGVSIDLRKWHLLTVTYNGSEARIYENGILLKKQAVSDYTDKTLGKLYIGFDEGGDYCFKGNMDDLRIYNRALSEKEIVALYEEGLKESPNLLIQEKALVAHYKFNGDYKDSSGFGNDAEKAAGKISYVYGKNSKAAKFSKGTYLEVLDDISIDFDEGFSMTGWINSTDDKNIMTILNRTGVSTTVYPDAINYRINMTCNYFDFEYVPFDYQTGEIGFRYAFENSMKNKWVHIGVTFDTKDVRWYYNGKMVKKEKVSEYSGNNMAHGIGDLMIGSDGDFFFTGTMDELKLYNYALSAKEVEKDYKNVDSLSISKDNQAKVKSMKKGNTVTLTTSRKYIDTGKTSKLTSGITYTSSNKKVFTVTSKGAIKAVGKGKANLTIKHGAISVTYKITVK
ncbi:MAG: hypothetical protein EWM47_07920 [Anaerolineaceae bacterium]|nr:MAG: hypothetical protein EWM47_07920 [Anaerolineaceae bacterium]